jgi:hypothetical protein
MTPIIIASDRARTTRTDILARSSVQRRQTHSYEHKERSLSGLAIFPTSDFVLVRTAGVTGPFETETRNTLQARLSVPQSQSAAVTSSSAIPAISPGRLIAGARCVLARHRPFTFLRRSRVQDCRQTPRRFCVSFHVVPFPFHALKSIEGRSEWNEKPFPNPTRVLSRVR